MMRTRDAMPRELLPSATGSRAGLLTARNLALAAAGGAASAAIGLLLGRTIRLGGTIPLSGSIVVAIPRTMILLLVLLGVKRFGALTAAGIAEVATKLALGAPGLMPWFLVVPILANLAGDAMWAGLRSLPSRRTGLMLTGSSLCAARVLIASLFWGLLGPSLGRMGGHPGLLLTAIIAVNVALGMIAGLLVSLPIGRRRTGAGK
jgi:hypothetical protein